MSVTREPKSTHWFGSLIKSDFTFKKRTTMIGYLNKN